MGTDNTAGKTVLVTGGAGYIGSHTCVELLASGYPVVVVDNLDNSSRESLRRVEVITGKQPLFYQADIRDAVALRRIFANHDIGAVIHFAGLKAVGESVEKPQKYVDYNISGTVCVLEAMRQNGLKTFIFSSSAAVYGEPLQVILQSFPLAGLSTSQTQPLYETQHQPQYPKQNETSPST